jgi:hypothetical protein
LSEATDWITALGTVGSAFGTVGVVWVSLWLARTQGRQTEEQVKRRQAELVTAWFVPYEGEQDDPHSIHVAVRVRNASDQLIYDLIAEVVTVQGAARRTAVGDSEENNRDLGALMGNVPPGETTTRINSGGSGMFIRHAIELAFRDAAGRYWLRHGDGTLEEVNKHPLDLYDISRPSSWEN